MDKKNLNEVKAILESVYQEVLKEAPKVLPPNKNAGKVKKEPVSKIDNADSLKNKGVNSKTIGSLNTAMTEWKQINDAIKKQTLEFNKKIEQDVKLGLGKFQEVESILKKLNVDAYEVNQIVAKMSKAYDREVVKYETIYTEALEKVNDEAKRILQRLYKKNKTTSNVPSKLKMENAKIQALVKLIEAKSGKKVEFLNEGIGEWIKSIVLSIKEYVLSFSKSVKNLASVVNATMNKPIDYGDEKDEVDPEEERLKSKVYGSIADFDGKL